MRYAAIAAHVGMYAVAFMCRVLGMAPSGYDGWRTCPTSSRVQEDEALEVEARAVFAAKRQRYGSPRVHAELRANGRRVGR